MISEAVDGQNDQQLFLNVIIVIFYLFYFFLTNMLFAAFLGFLSSGKSLGLTAFTIDSPSHY